MIESPMKKVTGFDLDNESIKQVSNQRQESESNTFKNNESPEAPYKLYRHQSNNIEMMNRPASVRTHYEKRDIKSILAVPKFKPTDADYLIKPKEMKAITVARSESGEGKKAGLFIPLDELEEEEHKKFAATRTWAQELERMSSPVKSTTGKTVSFNLEVDCAYETRPINRSKVSKKAGSPRSKDSKTTRNSEVVIVPRQKTESPIKVNSDTNMLQLDEIEEEDRNEDDKKDTSFALDLDL